MKDIVDRARETADKGAPEINPRSRLPKPCAEQRTRRNNQVPHQIVGANHPPLVGSRAVLNNERLASRLAELLEAANDECGSQPGNGLRMEQKERKESEENERGNHEGLAAVPIREIGNGNKTNHRRSRLQTGQIPELPSADSGIGHGIDHHPGEGYALAESNKDVREEQVPQLRPEIADARAAPPGCALEARDLIFGDAELDEHGRRPKQRRNDKRHAHAAAKAQPVDQQPSKNGANDDRNTFDNCLNRYSLPRQKPRPVTMKIYHSRKLRELWERTLPNKRALRA